MELSNLKSITIGGTTIDHIETHYNPNLKAEFKKTTLMTKTAVEEYADAKITDSNSFEASHFKNLTNDSAEYKNNMVKPYNYTISSNTVNFTEDTSSIIYVPSKLFTTDSVQEITPETINATFQISRIIVSEKFSTMNILTTEVQDIQIPNFNFTNVNENCFYITGHENKTNYPKPSACKGIVLGKEIKKGDFSAVDKIFVYTNSFPNGIVSRKTKVDYAAKAFNISSSKIYLYARLNDIYEITHDTTTEFENEFKVIKATSTTINIDTIYNEDYILDLSSLASTITITRNDSTSENTKLKGVIMKDLTIAATPGTTQRGFDKCIGLKTLVSSTASDNLFTDCANLSNAELSLTSIGENAFKGCGFESFEINVTTVGNNAFTNCKNLKNISINTTSLINFSGTSTGLNKYCKINVDTGNEPFARNYFPECRIGELIEYLFYGGASPTIDFSENYENNVVLVPNPKNKPEGALTRTGTGGNLVDKITRAELSGISTINDGFFQNCVNLTSVEATETVENIYTNAFKGCVELEEVKISNCTTIGERAFNDCIKLTEVDFPNCTSCGISVFNGCSNLKSANLPLCTTFGTSCFVKSAIEQVYFPACTSIGSSCFSNCTNIKFVNLPVCTTLNGSGNFNGCSAVEEIHLPLCTSAPSGCFAGCVMLRVLDIPLCQSIAPYSITQCVLLQSVDFPNCTSVGSSAFYACSSLTEIKLTADTITFSATCTGIGEGCKIYIKEANLTAAKSYFGESYTYITI